MKPRRLVTAIKLLVVRAVVWWVPPHLHAVVSGFPDDEGNSVEVVRRLADRVPVVWLVSNDPAAAQRLVRDLRPRHRLRILCKDSSRAYLAYVTAKFVFFTHGLYGSPPPPLRKVFVNLWHGDGPKLSKGFSYVHSTYAVAGTHLWGEQRPEYFGVRGENVLVTGHPRIDQFARPPGAEAVRRLGLDPDKPLVLWMPTYRLTEYRGRRLGQVRNWTDSGELTRQEGVVTLSAEVARTAERLGVTVAIKPHPLDGDRYDGLGLPLVSNDDLNREDLTVYQLLGLARGLITDYSSVWTDYLALNRPIGIYCPDLEEYEARRGLNVSDYLALIPGPRLTAGADFRQFLQECLDESPESRAIRARSAARIGAVTQLGATDRLLDAVGAPARPSAPAVPRQTSSRLRAPLRSAVTTGTRALGR